MGRVLRRLSHSSRGIAEIVGTLMLVLIVVAAAVALAAFIASYQAQLQSQQAESHERNLEALKVLSIDQITPEASPNQLLISSFTFTVASEFIDPSQVDDLAVNGSPLAHYLVQNISPSGGVPQCHDDSMALNLSPFQVVQVTVNDLTTGTCPNGFFTSPATVYVDSFLKVSLYTTLQNTFTQVFLPPTAVPLVGTTSQFTGSAFRDVPLLDGSSSFQQGNGTIDQWTWSIVNTTGGGSVTLPPVSGEKVVAPFASFTSFASPTTYTYSITLTVQNSDGLLDIASTNYSYVVP